MKKYTIEVTVTIKESESKYSDGSEIFEASVKTRTTVNESLVKDECLSVIKKAHASVARAVIFEPAQPKPIEGFEPPLFLDETGPTTEIADG